MNSSFAAKAWNAPVCTGNYLVIQTRKSLKWAPACTFVEPLVEAVIKGLFVLFRTRSEPSCTIKTYYSVCGSYRPAALRATICLVGPRGVQCLPEL